MDWQFRLIFVFLFIDETFKENLPFYAQRMSNNSSPDLTDEEVITIFLWGIMQHRTTIKEIYNYTNNHLLEWFPNLPSYEAYIMRLNRLQDVFIPLIYFVPKYFPKDYLKNIGIIDSMPIIMAKEKRSSKASVANDIANKGYCGSKGCYYYGVKVHILGFRRLGTLPLPEFLGVTPASNHDLPVFKQITPYIKDCEVYADKAYIDSLEREILNQQNAEIYTPVKKKKGQENLYLFEQLLSTSVSRVRQPIESLFNWIEEKTGIQVASKVRSTNGLMVHVFGRLAAALFLMAFNS
jgi:hypothetical protein